MDDNRDAADALGLLVRLWGHDARATYDGRAALRLAPEYRPDVVLLDIAMPGLNGVAVAQQLWQSGDIPRPLVIAVTGCADALVRDALAPCVGLLLRKPVDENLLEALLRHRAVACDYQLTLYVAGADEKSARAVVNLRRVCEEELPGRYRLDIIDVCQQPEAAERDNILMTPLLAVQTASRSGRVLGDLSDRQRVLAGLGLTRPDMVLPRIVRTLTRRKKPASRPRDAHSGEPFRREGMHPALSRFLSSAPCRR